MPSVTINAHDYPVYADVDFADTYLAADVSRAEPWGALADDDKKRALVTATRLLQRQSWRDGIVPDTDAPVEVVEQATSLLAIDIVVKPSLGDDASTGSNIKLVGGSGVPTIEFFRPVTGNALPPAAFALLRGLLGPVSNVSDPALDATAYGCDWQKSRFDPTDYGLLGDGLGPYDPTDYA